MPDENQRQYELTFILSPELEEKDITSFGQEVEKNIKDLGGSLKKKEKPEKRDLSYPIKKFQTGYYLVISFLFNSERLEELSTILKHKKDILRYIVNFVEEPSVSEDKKKRRQPKAGPPRTEKVRKFKEITEEISKEEIEDIKKKTKEKKSQPKVEKKKEKGVQLEEIDKKLDEILGI